MDKKRIAVISYHTCPLSDEDVTETGGLNIYVLELSKALAEKGYILDIYTRQADEDTPRVIQVSHNLRVIHLPGGQPAFIPKKQLLKHIPRFLDGMLEFIKEENLSYDLIYSHYYMSGLVGLKIKQIFKIPLVVNFHTLALMKNLVARSEAERESSHRIRSEMLILKKADKIIATSPLDAQYISALYDYPLNKISVLTPGVNLNLFSPINELEAKKLIDIKEGKRIILFVGRIEPLKGLDVLLYALKILKGKNPGLDFSLIVVGSRSKEMDRLKLVKKILKISTDISFVGKKSQLELPFFYNASKVVVMPSQYESFGIAALEAMACGTPVITTDVTGISSLFDENNHPLITSAGNPILLADKIQNLLTDNKEYKKLEQEVLTKAEKLSWDKVADEFIKIIK